RHRRARLPGAPLQPRGALPDLRRVRGRDRGLRNETRPGRQRQGADPVAGGRDRGARRRARPRRRCLLTDAATVLAEWGLGDARIERAPTGLINDTWIVDGEWVLQRVHPIFGAAVLDDIEAVTAHLAARGLETPRLVRTRAGALGSVGPDGRLWRVMTYVAGHTVERVGSPALAGAAGALVARFHAGLADLDWEYRFVRAGVHD